MSAQARALGWRTRAEFRGADGVLLVLRDPPPAPPPARGQPPVVPGNPDEGPEILLALADDGHAVGLAGHVDLGTGLATALAQIVAEELDLGPDRVRMVLGDTARAPNQGPTIASSSIQLHAQPLKLAAAQARNWLVAEAAERWGLAVSSIRTRDGEAIAPDGRRVVYAALVAGRHVELMLDASVALKPVADYSVVGRSLPRVDLPAKAGGEFMFVHDVYVPGMLHGRVVRPPYAGIDAGDFVGKCLRGVDASSVAHIPGVERIVVLGDFVGIVAQREEQAEGAMRALKVDWAPFTPLPPLDDLAQALSAHPSTPRVVEQHGDVDAALAGAATCFEREYVWPYQLHGSIGPSCAVAHWQGDRATVWAGTQNPHVLRADLSKLTGLADTAIEIVRLEAAGCYGRNAADDVAADALLLSRAVNAPVRVQLTREQEHAWEPKGAAQLMRVRGGLDAAAEPVGYDFSTRYPSNAATTLALLLTGTVPADARTFEMGDRTSVPPYAYPNQRITVHDMAPILRASWLRGVSALPNSFAHECFIDELASAARADPVEFRLRHLRDERAAALVRATADKAGWRVHTEPGGQGADGDWLRGQGFAYARYVHSRFPGFGAAWSAWVADVEVHRVTGEVAVRRVVVGQDAGLMINPKGVEQQVHGNVLQTTSRALKERVAVDPRTRVVESREWGSYPILGFREVPVVEVLLLPRPDEPPLGVGESSSVPGTAAIANAIFDATGVRLRQPPFTPEAVRAAWSPPPSRSATTESVATRSATPPTPASPAMASGADDPQRRRKPWWAIGAALATGVLGLGAAALGWRPAIAPVRASVAGVYDAALIARGAELAAIGNCLGCHTAEGGPAGAGGRPIQTPFGTVWSTNITPDPATGIGAWSFSAFQRAMREGVARDGHHLYPAFPYTAYTQVGDDDLTALYAWVMTREPVVQAAPATRLRAPFDLRPLMTLWNARSLQTGPSAPDATKSAKWQRGAYLVDGLGHCGACHTPRDAFGAERNRGAYLAGALADGWEAPALGALAAAPVAWTESAMVRYLRDGFDPEHGIAGGAMAPVVRSLAGAAAADIEAIAHYLVSLQRTRPPVEAQAIVAAAARRAPLPDAAQRLFDSACGACHHDGEGPQTEGPNLPLALNVNLHSARPDNLVLTILDGIGRPATPTIGHMPGFRHALSDRQIATLAAWMRRRFAPDATPWPDLESNVARLRGP